MTNLESIALLRTQLKAKTPTTASRAALLDALVSLTSFVGATLCETKTFAHANSGHKDKFEILYALDELEEGIKAGKPLYYFDATDHAAYVDDATQAWADAKGDAKDKAKIELDRRKAITPPADAVQIQPWLPIILTRMIAELFVGNLPNLQA